MSDNNKDFLIIASGLVLFWAHGKLVSLFTTPEKTPVVTQTPKEEKTSSPPAGTVEGGDDDVSDEEDGALGSEFAHSEEEEEESTDEEEDDFPERFAELKKMVDEKSTQLFNLIDENNTGSISYNEWIDTNVIIGETRPKGKISPENKKRKISLEEFKEHIKNNLDARKIVLEQSESTFNFVKKSLTDDYDAALKKKQNKKNKKKKNNNKKKNKKAKYQKVEKQAPKVEETKPEVEEEEEEDAGGMDLLDFGEEEEEEFNFEEACNDFHKKAGISAALFFDLTDSKNTGKISAAEWRKVNQSIASKIKGIKNIKKKKHLSKDELLNSIDELVEEAKKKIKSKTDQDAFFKVRNDFVNGIDKLVEKLEKLRK